MQPDVLVTGKHGVLRPRLYWIYLLCGLLACVGPWPALGHTTEAPTTEGPTKTNCETPCPDKCLCSAVPKACTVDCTGQGLRQVPSPTGLPIPTKKLILSENNVSTIAEDAFKSLQNLEELIMDRNNISSLPNRVFNNLSSLKILNLTYNCLESLEVNSFEGLTSLEELLLQGNKLNSVPDDLFADSSAIAVLSFRENLLTTLPENVFQNLTSLQELDLSKNRLTSMSKQLFTGLHMLHTLDLSSNELDNLTYGVFDDLVASNSSLTSLSLGSNPYQCTCDLFWLPLWLTVATDANITLPDQPNITCVDPQSNTVKHVAQVDFSPLNCKPCKLSAGLLAILRKHRHSKVHWHEKHSLSRHRSSRGRRNAQSYGACYTDTDTGEESLVFFQYEQSGSHDTASCNAICYAQGYSYGGLPDAQDTCYCGELAESFPFYTGCKLLWCEWDHTISISIQQSVCQGHLGIPSSFKTFPTFHISNTRTYYSINEDIDFTLAGILTDSTKSYVWDLGDGSPQVNKTGLSINHKYSVDGTYTLLVEGLYNGTVVTTWMSVVIVTPITGVTLTCPPSHYTGSDAFSVTLEAQTGYNISVQWLVSDYHVEGFITDEPDADYRQYYMVGSVVFDSVDIPAVNMTAQAGVASANTKRLLLFPGMWFQHTGLLSTWEFVAAPGVSNIHLQVYRPTCPGFGSYLLPPGCQSLPSPYATCVSGQLCNATDSCPAGQQYCYLSSSCQAITEPCSEYAMMNQALPPRYINAQPNYTLAGETNLHISVTERTLVRVDISQQPITVYQDDIIGVQFDSKDALQYYNSSTSEWVQSALYMEQDDWVQMWTQPEEYSDTWFDDALFEIRAMYTVSETFSYSPSNADIIKARPVGTVTFAAIVENPVTQRTARNCTITFEDAIEGAELIYPIPGDDGIIRLETGKEYNFVVMITKGTDVSATFIFWSEVHAGIPVQDTCPDDMEDVPQECTPTSNTTSYAFYSKQYDSSTNQFHLSVQLTNLVTQVTATSTVQVDEVISGVTISSSSPRTAEGIEQTFTVSYATGTSVNSYEWYIDDSVVLNADSSSFFHTFSEASTHTIYVVIENPHGAANATLDITIDQMEAMQDLMFVNAPALEAAGDAVTFTATAAVDSYYDYTWQWDYGDGHSDTISSSAPYTGDTPIANTYLVQHGESINHTFANPGIYTVNVLVFNNYGNISAQHTVEIRPKLTGVSVTAEPVAVERGEPVTLTATPHGATEDVTYKWNYDDSSTDEGSSNVSIHTYTVAATYNVSVTADNGVSKAASFVLVKAQVKVTGLELSTDPEVTEMNEVTTLTATVQTGTDLLYNSDMGDGFVLYNLTSPFVHTYTYPGNYTANVTAFNDISSEWETITVMVISSFTIDNVTSGSCTELGKMTTFEASITTDNIDILQFTWYFGDGNATTVLGSPIITHRYGTTGNFTVRLKVENTQKVLWETIYGCVQEPISGVYVTASGPTALGHETTVNVVLGTGSHYVYRVDFGDGVLETYDGGSDVKHVYGSAGSYNVTVTVENEVTTTTVTTTARVVEEISGISITHNGTNQDFVRSQSLYTYQANVARGTEVDYTWNFGYDQEIVSGEIQTYQYDASGIYIVTVNASNDVSSSSNSKIITVQDTIHGLHLSSNATEILVGSSIFFDADITAGTDPKYTWKLCSTCSSFVGSDSITRPFDAVGTFEVSVNVANEVSSEEVSTSITVIYPVKGAQISGDLTAGSLHAAGQAYTFSASVTEGSADHYQWEVSKYGSHIGTFTGSEVHITFPDYGQYDVSVVVSNSVSDSEASMAVDVIELVTDVDLTASKTMASNEDEVTFTAASTGTNLTFVWSLGDGSPNIETTEPQVQHQYNLAGTFLVTVNVSNDLSSLKSTSLPVEILEKISGLDLETTTTDTNYYAGQNEFTNFVATLTSGSNVTYSWRFTDGGRETSFNGLDLDEAKMVYNMLGNQTASLSADNDVSHQNITRTIVVQKRPTVVTLWPNASYVETLDVISITQQVEGTDLEYELDFGDGQQMIGDSLPSTILHSYSKTGTYALSLTVKNFVGQEEYVVSITVLQRIEGLAINTNCIMPYCTNGFLSLGEELEYAAKWVQGNNITFTWVVVQADGSTIGSTGETMTFAPTQLGSQSVTLRAENWLNSVSVAETFTVQEEIVSATLTTSNIINLYENATVSFHMGISSGSDVYYEWEFNDGFPIFETSVSDQNRTFPTAGDYLVRVKAFNNISLVVKEIAITIRELMCQEPTVDRVGLFSKEVLRSSEAFLEVDVNTFDCTKYRVIHQWTVYQGSQCGVNNITLPSSVNRASTRLILPKQTLGYDLYCIEYQIVYQDTPVLSVVRFSLRVKASPLTPLIKGGTERTQSSTQELLLDGTSSFDPDTPDKTGLTFQWNCQAYTTQNGPNDPTAACNVIDWATLQHKSLVSIPANTLPEGTTFLLNLTVGKQDRVPQSAQQTIVVNVQNVPSVFITCVSCISLNTMTISWNQHVTVTGECQNCNPGAVYKWDVRADDNSVFELNEYTTTTGDSSRNLVLRPGALASGHGYTFTLTVTDGSQHGYATLHLDHNEPPSGGLCTVSASEAKIIASYTTVTFDCSGWNDNNNIYADLLINIIVMRQTGQHTFESFLLYRGTQTTYQSTLPVGLEDWNHNVRVVILVEDRLGAQAEAFNSTMTVEYPEKTDLNGFDTVVQWLSNRTSTDLQNAEQNGNNQLILGLALTSATLLNVRSGEAWASDANDGEFSDRENLRSDIINTVTSLSGSISTKEDSKQVSAVLSLCTMFPPEMISETSHQGITSALEDLVQIQEEEAEEGQVVDMDTATNIMNIISNLMDAANLNIYEPTTDISVSFSESHRREVVTNTYSLASRYNYALLKSKVEGEEDIVINAPSISSRAKLTQASVVSTAQNISGSQFVVPRSVLGASSEVVSQVEMVFDTNPFTWGHQHHISSQMMSLQFARSDQTEVSVDNLPEESQIKAFMVEGGLRNTIIGGSLVGSPGYDPSEGLDTTDGTIKGGGAINVIVNITDCRSALHIQVRYNETVAGSTEEDQSVTAVYVGTNNRTLVLTQALMTGDHRDYTMFFPPSEHAGMSQVNLTITNNYQKQDVQVSVGLYCSSCLYYNQDTGEWDDAGLTASAESTATVSVCYTSHLTSFGAVVLLPPNAITLEDFPTLEDIAQNPVALITCMCWLAVFLVAGFVVRKLDLRDIRKVAVVPLCGRDGPYKYEISVMTGMTRNSGTTAHVGVNIFGSNGKKSGRRVLLKPNAFLRNSTDVFQIAVDGSLGDIIKIKIWHDNTGLDPSWNLKSLVVHDIQTDKRYHFLANSWFSLEEPDGFVEKDVYVASPDALKKFSTVFKNETARGLSEQHLWLSVLERPARNRFTRVQRVTCLATLVYSFMCVNAMWYGLIKTNTEDVEIWYFAFSWEELAVGIISNLMVFPINLLIVTLFRKIKSKVKATDYYEPVAQRAQTAQTIEMDVMCATSQNGESLITMSGQSDPFALSFDPRTGSMKHSQSFRHGGLLDDDDDDSDDEAEYRPRGGKMSMVDSWEDLRKDKRSLQDRNKLWSYESIMNWSDTEQVPSKTKKSQLKRKKTGRYGNGKDIPGIHVDAVLSDDDDDDSWGKTAPTPKIKKSGNFLSTKSQADGKMSRTHSVDDLLTSDEFWSSIMDETSDQKDSSRTLQSSGSFTPRSDADLDSGIGDPIHKTLEPSIHSESDQSQQTQTFLLESDTTSLDSSVPPQRRRLGRPASSSSVESLHEEKGKWLLPYWFVYIAYLLCAIIIAGCMVVIIMYGQAFGRDQATKWVLSMFLSLIQSMFLMEPIRVILIALFLASISKPTNHDDEDDLVDRPVVENQDDRTKSKAIRAPYGYGLLQAREEARKVRVMYTIIHQCIFYLLFILTILIIAFNDNDLNTYRMTHSIEDSLVKPEFGTSNRSFLTITQSEDWWEYMDSVLLPTLLDTSQGPIRDSRLEGVVLGGVRLRQIRNTPETCMLQGLNRYPNLWTSDWECYYNVRLSTEDSSSYGETWIASQANQANWTYSETNSYNGLMYYGRDGAYSDNGYILDLPRSYNASITALAALNSSDWIDRGTRAVFVEFSLYNPNVNLFSVVTLLLELPVTGVGRASRDVKSGRFVVYGYGVDLLMIMQGLFALFLLYYIVVECCQLKRHGFKSYLKRFQTYYEWTIIIISTSSLAVYIHRLMYTTGLWREHLADKTKFISFFHSAYLGQVTAYLNGLVIFLLMIKVARQMRFRRQFSIFGKALRLVTWELAGCFLIFFILILTYAQLGYLLFSNHSPYFTNMWMSITAMVAMFRGQVDLDPCREAQPFLAFLFFTSYILVVFCIVGRLFGAILIHGFTAVRKEMHRPAVERQDYEMVEFMIKRFKMWTGLAKPKAWRHNVKFLGMDRLSTRSSRSTVTTPGGLSHISTPNSPISLESSGSVGLGHIPEVGQMDPNHLEYLLDRLTPTVDAVLSTFDRLRHYVDDDNTFDEEPVQPAHRSHQRTNVSNETQQKRNINVSRKDAQSAPAKSGRSSNRVLKASSSWTQGIPGQEKALPTQRENSWTKGSSTSGPPSRRDQSSAWRQNKEVSWADRYKDSAWGSSNWTRKGASDPWGDRRREDSWEQSHPRSTTNSPARKKEHSWSSDYGSSRRQGSRGSVPQRPTPKKPAW